MTKVYDIVPMFIECIPVPAAKEPISAELAQVMKDSFTFIHKFYMEFDSKKDGKAALINLLQLSEGSSEVSVGVNDLKDLTNDYVRDTVCE